MPATAYAGAAKALVHALKFGRAKAAARDIAEIMAARLPCDRETLVTYVPTAPLRARQRGYDQAKLVARELARRLDLPCLALLERRGSQRQVGQSRAARKQQMSGAYLARHVRLAAGRQILLIDDVLTTGATCEAAAHALISAGAGRVHVAVFAVA